MRQRSPISLEKWRGEDKTQKCPECGSKNIEHESGELVCKECGLVLE